MAIRENFPLEKLGIAQFVKISPLEIIRYTVYSTLHGSSVFDFSKIPVLVRKTEASGYYEE